MHAEAMQYVASWVKGRVYRRVLEFGSLDINGTARSVIATYDGDSYFGIDAQGGRGVDEVIDAGGSRWSLSSAARCWSTPGTSPASSSRRSRI
jgi:hypothetical protein